MGPWGEWTGLDWTFGCMLRGCEVASGGMSCCEVTRGEDG